MGSLLKKVQRGLGARRAISILTLFLVLAVACGGVGKVAEVDGESISFDEVHVLIPDSDGVVDTTRFASSLMLMVADRVMVAQAEEQFGIVRTYQLVDAKVAELVSGTGLSAEEIYEQYGLTEASVRIIAAQEVTAEQVRAELTASLDPPSEEALREAFEGRLSQLAQVCAAHILLETEEAGQAAYNRAVAGEDFGTLAMELSVGPSGPNGGDLGCTSPGSYVEEFANATLEAEIGVPFMPVQTQFGWHVILVTDRTVPDFEEVRPSLQAEVLDAESNQLWLDWFLEALNNAEVTVEPEYGTWTTDPTPDIIPPES